MIVLGQRALYARNDNFDPCPQGQVQALPGSEQYMPCGPVQYWVGQDNKDSTV